MNIASQALLPQLDHTRIPRAVTPRAVAGIDPSLTSCALVIGKTGEAPIVRVFSSAPASSPRARAIRYRSLVQPIVELIVKHEVSMVLIEGVAHAAMMRRDKKTGQVLPVPQQGHHDRAELRGVLNDRLVDVCPVVLEPAPTTLKQYQGGKGNLSKVAAVSAFSVAVGREFKTSDEADAYALMMLAMCVSGQSAPETSPQRKAVLQVLSMLREAA